MNTRSPMRSLRHNSPRHQRGVALAVGLLLLLVLTVIGIGALRSTLFESQMARNEQYRITSFERAQSLIDATIADSSNMIVSGSVGDITCMNKDENTNGCTGGHGTLEVVADVLAAPHGDRSSVFVERLAPDFTPAPRGLGFSVDFDAAQFEVTASYDASSAKLGRSSIAQGVMVLVKASQ